jgi:hypothetical protein
LNILFIQIISIKEFFSYYWWLLTQWWFWLVFVTGVLLYWFLFGRRVYKIVGKKLFVRHGQLGDWLDIEEHLKNEHPLEYEEYKKREKGQ